MTLTTIRFPPPFVGHMRPVTGAPYCADEVSEHIQTLADGTHITSKERMIKQCRDSAGRTRREESLGGRMAGRPDPPVLIHIDDPVANVRYILDPQNKIAHRHPLSQDDGEPARTPHHLPVAASAREKTDIPRPHSVSENLGKETIEGLTVNGMRTTTTYPVGSVGNDKEFTATHEHWMSPDLRLSVLSRNVDPRSGEDTRKLVNISTSEPDPALFEVPEGYSMSDDDEFRVEWKMPPPQ